MIYFLHGPDTYRSRQKLREIAREFQKKAGESAGVVRVDACERPAAVYDLGRTASLFSPKELVVIENAAATDHAAQEYLARRLKEWATSRDLIVVFWEGEVKAKAGLAGAIVQAARKSQEFKTLPLAGLSRWLDSAAAERKIRLSAQDQEVLIAKYGPDLWALSNELDKVAAGWAIGDEVREEEKMWSFTDAYVEHPRRAFRPLAHLLASGYEPIYLLGALASSLRTLALVWWGVRRGRLTTVTRSLHPFVVRKNAEVAKRVAADSLRQLFERLITADIEQKTGRLSPPLPLVKLVLRRRPPA